uniref:transposase n=1 Tax=Paenibacillus sp. FSL L8-0436 TaxID=2954686 RepID=UPI00406C6E11
MRRYEIRDNQWEKIKDLLPPERKPQGGRPPKGHCQMLNAVLWVHPGGIYRLTGGQSHDSITGCEILKQMDFIRTQVLADSL